MKKKQYNSAEKDVDYFKAIILKYKKLTKGNIQSAAKDYLFILEKIFSLNGVDFDITSLKRIDTCFDMRELSSEERCFYSHILGLALGQTVVNKLQGKWVKKKNLGHGKTEFAVVFHKEHRACVLFPFTIAEKFLVPGQKEYSLASVFVAMESISRNGLNRKTAAGEAFSPGENYPNKRTYNQGAVGSNPARFT